jgi:hypothetical protein
MPRIGRQENRRGTDGTGLLAKPAAAPAILLWMQKGGGGARLPADDKRQGRAGLRAAMLAAAVIFGGFALASMPPPEKIARAPQIAVRTMDELEAEERQTLRLAESRAGAFDRARDLGAGFNDMPPITVLEEPVLDTALGSLAPIAEEPIGPESPPAPPPPKFVQEFWRTVGHSRLSDTYAAYLGRFSWKIAEQRPVIDLDLGRLAQVDAEEMKRLDARRVEARLHLSLIEVPIPKRAPRARVRKPGSSKAAVRGCRNRIWRCGPPIAPMAQGNVQRVRSRPN